MRNAMYSVMKKEYPVVERAEGMYVYDTQGNKYLDCASGIAVTNIGYGVKEVIEAMYEQAKKVTFVYGGVFTSEAKEELASRIIDMAPLGMEKVFFCSGGSEAMEAVVKIARQYHLECNNTSKHKVISRWQSYHGNTMMTLAIGGRPSWRKDYGPYFPQTSHVAQCNCYRCPFGLEYGSCDIVCAKDLERTINYEGADTVAAFVLEPIIGTTASATAPPKEYMREIRRICDKYNVLLCFDEVITGFGRTGKNFATDHFDIVPDIIGFAKGLGCGYTPIGGAIVNRKIVNAMLNGSGQNTMIYTFAGTPLSCATANATLKYMNDNKLIENSERMGKVFVEELKVLETLECVGEVRGIGLMLGIELVRDKKTKEPFLAEERISGKVAEYCFKKGLIITGGVPGSADGQKGEALQIAPPFIITKEQISFAVGILKEAIETVYNEVKKG